MLPVPPGGNPLTGASFFVRRAGTRRGGGHDRAIPWDRQQRPSRALPAVGRRQRSWTTFKQFVENKLSQSQGNPALVRDVRMLEKIADQPEAQRVSVYSEGGGPGAISDLRASCSATTSWRS